MKRLNEAITFTAQQAETTPAFRPLVDFPFIILVGLTGVGKSTLISLLQTRLDFMLLPDRRQITDEIIITSLQQEDGHAPTVVVDRLKRFEYTARYRAKYPGGMAHALSRLAVDPGRVGSLLLFDGLRGLNEVRYAATYFPQARFIVLDAPDIIRLTRLLNRGDLFDTTKLPTSLEGQTTMAALKSIPQIEAVFSEEELGQMSHITSAGRLPVDELLKKASIIVEERRNYDSSAARVYLTNTLPRQQVLIIDTATQLPEAVAKRIIEWLNIN